MSDRIELAERNAATVHAMYQYERDRDIDRWIALWSPVGRQTFPFGEGMQPVTGIEALRRSTTEKFATRGPVSIVDTVYPTLDPRWVFAITDVSIVFEGRDAPFEAQLWCRFGFDDQGLIELHEEVLDTAAAEGFFRSG